MYIVQPTQQDTAVNEKDVKIACAPVSKYVHVVFKDSEATAQLFSDLSLRVLVLSPGQYLPCRYSACGVCM